LLATDICNIAIYTEGTLGVKLFKIVHCYIRKKVVAALSRFLIDGYPLIVFVVQK